MGQTMLGGTEFKENIDLLNPQQQQFLQQILSQAMGGQEGEFDAMFQKSFVDPSINTLNRQIIPQVKESFLGLDESGSSALNRALAQSASDVSSMLGQQQMGQFNRLMQTGLGTRSFEPHLQKQTGLAGPLVQGASSALAAALLASSRDYKENIKPLKRGLEDIAKMSAYQYDYKPEISNSKNNVGVMVEDAPKEIVKETEGLKAIDMYGLVSVLVNAVNELNTKVDMLSKKGD